MKKAPIFMQKIDDTKLCMLSELVACLEKHTGLDLQSQPVDCPSSIKMQNEELFPFIKQHTVVLPEPKN